MRLPITTIRVDGGTQTRAEIDLIVVADYCGRMQEGVAFPPVVVFYDGTDHWMADGFHRVNAGKAAGLANIEADVRQGTRRDAILYSVGANAAHGLRRTNADKRRAVETLLRDDEWRGWSDRSVAERCGVGHPFVAKIRAEVAPLESDSSARVERKTADGRVMNTANIGKAKPAAEPEPVARDLFDEDDDTPDVVREPDVYEPEPTVPIRRDPPPHTGWGASELSTFATDLVIACRRFQADVAQRFAGVDPRYTSEAKARAEAVLFETTEALRAHMPSDAAPRFSVIKGGK